MRHADADMISLNIAVDNYDSCNSGEVLACCYHRDELPVIGGYRAFVSVRLFIYFIYSFYFLRTFEYCGESILIDYSS